MRVHGNSYRANKISQLTVDHSLAQALVEANTITAAEAKEHKFRNVLWKYLGSAEVGDGPDVAIVNLQGQDRVMLCTDGLTGVVNDDGIMTYITGQTVAVLEPNSQSAANTTFGTAASGTVTSGTATSVTVASGTVASGSAAHPRDGRRPIAVPASKRACVAVTVCPRKGGIPHT